MSDWILGKQGGKVWAGFISLRIVTSDHENGNEPSGCIKDGELLE
jgi:hypothetical protein